MIKIAYKSKMSTEELHNFFKNWAEDLRTDTYGGLKLCRSSIKVYVPKKDFFSELSEYKQDVIIYGNNNIKLGELKPDYGLIESGVYYPIIKFYNQLNFSSRFCAFNSGQPNNYRVEFEKDDSGNLLITEKAILDAVKKSFEFVGFKLIL